MWIEYLWALYLSVAIVAVVCAVPSFFMFFGIYHSLAQCGYGGSHKDDDFPALLFGSVALVCCLASVCLSFFAFAAMYSGCMLTRSEEFRMAKQQGGFSSVAGAGAVQMAEVQPPPVQTLHAATVVSAVPVTGIQPPRPPAGDLYDNTGRPISL